MSTKKNGKVMVKKLRYVLNVVVFVEVDDPDEISDIIERNREQGSCEVVEVSVIEVPYGE